MKPFPRLRPTAWDGLVVLCVAALALGIAFFQWRGGTQEGLTAVASVDGREVDRFPLEELIAAPRAYEHNGYTLEVCAALRGEVSSLDHVKSDGEMGLRVARSDCPTQDCVHTGTITRSGQSIVCLPARVIIRLEGGAADPGNVDAVTG